MIELKISIKVENFPFSTTANLLTTKGRLQYLKRTWRRRDAILRLYFGIDLALANCVVRTNKIRATFAVLSVGDVMKTCTCTAAST